MGWEKHGFGVDLTWVQIQALLLSSLVGFLNFPYFPETSCFRLLNVAMLSCLNLSSLNCMVMAFNCNWLTLIVGFMLFHPMNFNKWHPGNSHIVYGSDISIMSWKSSSSGKLLCQTESWHWARFSIIEGRNSVSLQYSSPTPPSFSSLRRASES